MSTGIEKRYTVKRTDGRDAPGEKHDGCEYFVLDLTHDAAARAAAMAYARSVGGENPQLLIDLVDQVSRLDGASECCDYRDHTPPQPCICSNHASSPMHPLGYFEPGVDRDYGEALR